jgi:hypothetical protein
MPDAVDLGSLNTGNWGDLEELADALEQSWKKGQPTDVAEFLPPAGAPLRPLILQELIKTDLECRWRHGQGVRLDYYLEKFAADLGPVESVPAALIYEEYRVRQLFGDRPALAELQERFPKQFSELERLVKENPLPPESASPEGGTVVGAGPVVEAGPLSTAPAAVSASSQAAAPKAGPSSFRKDLVLPQTGGYTLIERIGTGGFAEVWKAQAPGGVLKAIKIIVRPIDQEETKRELEAMELMKVMRHHFLLPVHSFWPLEDRLYVLMDLADGSLRDCLNRYRKEGKQAIPAPELLRYMRQTAEALDYLHEKKVQHRDIKPENILLTEGNVRVADFGLAKAQGTQRLMDGTFAGTFFYMPPETWNEKTHVNGDQYSLAATYFELRTGRRLFKEASAPALMICHLQATPNLDPLGADEQRVLLRALAKNPDDRYSNCMTFVRALEKAVAGELPAQAGSLPAAPQTPTAGDHDRYTVVPGQGTKPASWRVGAEHLKGGTTAGPSGKETLAPAASPTMAGADSDRKPGSNITTVLAACLVLLLLAVPAWIIFGPTWDTGDLTLLPLEPAAVRAGEAVTVPITIKRDNFAEPVLLKFTSARDITLEETTIPAGATSAEISLRTSAQATPGPRRITVEASGGVHCAYLVFDVTINPRGR